LWLFLIVVVVVVVVVVVAVVFAVVLVLVVFHHTVGAVGAVVLWRNEFVGRVSVVERL